MFLGRKKFESVKWGHGHYQLLGHSFRTSVVRNSNTTFTYFVKLYQQANLVGVGGGGGAELGGRGGGWNSWKKFESVKWGHGHYQLLGHIFGKSIVRNSNTMFTYFVKLCLEVKFVGGRGGGGGGSGGQKIKQLKQVWVSEVRAWPLPAAGSHLCTSVVRNRNTIHVM